MDGQTQGQMIGGSLRGTTAVAQRLEPAAPREQGASYTARGLQELLQISASLNERLSQFTDKLVGPVPRDASNKAIAGTRQHSGFIGEIEGSLSAVRDSLDGVNESLNRLERLL